MSHWKQIQAAKAVLSRETGTVYKDPGGKLTVALAYPNTYYVGMSSLGMQIVYRAFNDRSDVVCERVFWDAGAAAAELPLLSLESQSDVRSFAVLAFTISFEMDYFNVIAMLRQAGIPALAEERLRSSEVWPLLIAGGPGVTMNPEPMAPFFDAMVIGEGEEVIPTLVDTTWEGIAGDRDLLLDALDRIPGVYVPQRAEPSPSPDARRIQRRWVRQVDSVKPVSSLYTPDTEFSGMHLMEIARGCGRGCRYCLAGHVYRPPRELPAESLLAWATEAMAQLPGLADRSTGIGLVSAAVSDHSEIDALAEELQARGMRISVSSMRFDPLSLPLVKAMAASGAQTLTIAPEAGSERLRQAINKTQSEADLLAAVELAQALDFPQLKMYYMIGHPGEEEEDIQGIVDLTLRAKALFKRNVTINATPFVPKANTPFQWVGMTPVKVMQRRQAFLKRALIKQRVIVHADSPHWAEVQAVLARGDRRLAPVLVDMPEITPGAFRAALARHGLDAAEFAGARHEADFLPWEIVESGVSRNYLRREYRLAGQQRPGHRCPPNASGCLACGACVPEYAFRFREGQQASTQPKPDTAPCPSGRRASYPSVTTH